MNIREMTEKIEKDILSPNATLCIETRGRETFEEQCDIRTCF